MTGLGGTPKTGARAALAAAVVVGLLGPLAVVFMRFWIDSSEELTAARQERRGVAYLRPLTALLGELLDAQSAAVRRTDIDPGELRDAMTAVDVADRRHGAALGTGERWRALRQRLADLAGRRRASPATALTDYAEAARLAVDLVVKVGDTSGLVLEPRRDAYYLMDAVVRRLPEVVTGAGYLADLGYVTTATEDRLGVQLLTARDRVISASEATEADLRRSLESTNRDTLGAELLGPADAFVAAAGEISSGAVRPPGSSQANSEELTRLSRGAQAAALQLQAAGVAELDNLLLVRESETAGTRRLIGAVVLIGLFVAATATWLQLPRRDAVLDGSVEGDGDELSDAAPEAVGRHADREEGPVEAPELIDARELLGSAELVRVGRAVRTSTRRRPDNEAGT